AREVRGSAKLNAGGSAAAALSCAAPGSCAAGGNYTDASGARQAFVVSQAHGAWGQALEVPGIAALNAGGMAFVLAVSCAAPGRCGAGGRSADGAGHSQVFVVSES